MPPTLILENDVTTRELLAFLLKREDIAVQTFMGNADGYRYLQICPAPQVVIFIDNAYPKWLTHLLLTAIPIEPPLHRHAYLLLSGFAAQSAHPYHEMAHASGVALFTPPFQLPEILTCIRDEVTRLSVPE